MKQNLLDSLVVPSSWNSRDGGGCGAYVTQGSPVGTRKSHVASAQLVPKGLSSFEWSVSIEAPPGEWDGRVLFHSNGYMTR